MLLFITLLAIKGARSREWKGAHDIEKNKFTDSSPKEILEFEFFGTDASRMVHQTECPAHLEIVWNIYIPGGVYASPILGHFLDISDSSPGDPMGLQVLVPSYRTGELHLLDSDGHNIPGWPFATNDRFQGGPIVSDLSQDGFEDIIWISIDGKIYVISGGSPANPTPALLGDPLQIPPLQVDSEWFQGISDTSVEASMSLHPDGYDKPQDSLEINGESPGDTGESPGDTGESPGDTGESPGDTGESPGGMGESRDSGGSRRLLGVAEEDGLSPYEGLSGEARRSFEEVSRWMSTSFHRKNESEGESEEVKGGERIRLEGGHVWVDAHVLGSPALADSDGDGVDDRLIISVSYYFDSWHYRAHPELMKDLPSDFDHKNYVANGVVCMRLSKDGVGSVEWVRHLDLTTSKTELKAMIYGTPTVVDLDGDGQLEILVGTRLGFVYLMDVNTGTIQPNFPLIMDDIQGQIAVADLIGNDGNLEIIVCDANGNVAVFTKQGEEVWSKSVTGFATQIPAIGDIDGDGVLDLAFGLANSEYLWALNGRTGETLKNFPVRLGARVIAPVLLVPLTGEKFENSPEVSEKFPGEGSGLHLIVMAFDGFLYVVNGVTGCVDKLDMGEEESYTMVLVDDILGHGKLDLLVSTMQGSVACISTHAPYHPLSTTRSQNPRSGLISKRDKTSLYLDTHTQNLRAISGPSIPIGFHIRGTRAGTRVRVSVAARGGVLLRTEVGKGHHIVEIGTPEVPGEYRIEVRMIDEHGLMQEEVLIVDVNGLAHRLVKWAFSLPFLVAGLGILLIGPRGAGRWQVLGERVS
ncbi:hypothetical protein AAMO2058_000695000 [Amorphochlora amoebiformis]